MQTKLSRSIPSQLIGLGLLFGLNLLLGPSQAIPASGADWTTLFEASAGQQTPRYSETVAYCQRLADASPWLQYTTFGTSPQGRGLPLLIADRRGNFDPRKVRATGNVVLMVEACIHAGECSGKDAGLMLLRDMTVAGKMPELLQNVTVLFIPIFNVDGHERFGPYNRANQDGPQEMGWRVNARNLNLNRDFLKADTPEMQDWLLLWNRWLPDFFIDVHATDGADYQYVLTYSLETRGNLDPGLTQWTRDRYLGSLETSMAEAGFPIQSYCTFRHRHDPRSGLLTWVAGPRFSQGYAAIQNRPGLLIETHMMKPYPQRVQGTYLMLQQTLQLLNADHATLRELNLAADARTASAEFRAEPFALQFDATGDSTMIDFLGVEYDILQSETSGGEWMKFYGDRPATFHIPFFDTQRPSVTARLPEAYLIPPEWDDVIERLQWHGVRIVRLTEPTTIPVETLKFESAEWSAAPYEGRQTVETRHHDFRESRLFPAGTAIVDMNQRCARVAAHILEPDGPDSYVRWGFFAPVFNRVEYIESYVIEEMMIRMLAEDPGLAAELETVKAADPGFAANPWAIRYWFYARTPWYDARHNIYPVARLFDAGQVQALKSVSR